VFVYFSEYLRASIQNENTFINMSIDCYLLRLLGLPISSFLFTLLCPAPTAAPALASRQIAPTAAFGALLVLWPEVNAPHSTDCGSRPGSPGGAVETYPAVPSRLLSQAVAAAALPIISPTIRC
jgi:hypothetical protein